MELAEKVVEGIMENDSTGFDLILGPVEGLGGDDPAFETLQG